MAEGGSLKKNRASAKNSMAQFQFFRDRLITVQVVVLQIFQQTPALADHHQQSAARTVILFVVLQMLGQMIDPLREQRDLHVRRPRVAIVQLERFDCLRLCFHIRLNTAD